MGAGTALIKKEEPNSRIQAEFRAFGLWAEFHAISVNSTFFRDFQLLLPNSTRHQTEIANSNPDREFQPKTRIPRRLAPRGLGDVGRGVLLLLVWVMLLEVNQGRPNSVVS